MKNNSNTKKQEKFLPIWIWIIVVLEIITPIFFALMAIKDISIMFPEQEGLNYLATLYISRNIAIGIGLALASFLCRSYIATALFIIVRMSMEVSDFTNSYLFERGEDIIAMIPGGVVIFLIIPAIALYKICPKITFEYRYLRNK